MWGKEIESVGRDRSLFQRVLPVKGSREMVGRERWTVKTIFKIGKMVAYLHANLNDSLEMRTQITIEKGEHGCAVLLSDQVKVGSREPALRQEHKWPFQDSRRRSWVCEHRLRSVGSYGGVEWRSSLLTASLFSEKNGSKVISESTDGKGSIVGIRCKIIIWWLRW